MFNKKGVSLITVLLFMLVATIAATATFKWLTSENRSSASRMKMRDAYQSAVAGIQSTRAWMTNNANDVGSLVNQFFAGEQKPIKLNAQVKDTILNNKQRFNIWLTGVSEINGTHKLKILSEGITNDSARHTEAAVLNVSGLYRVTLPEDKNKTKDINFEYTYFGGSVRNNGNIKISSMLINGNWHGNPVEVDKNIIITGIARLSGSNVDILGTGCIGGDLYADNGIDAKNLFVGGTAKKFGTKNNKGVTNLAYFDGVVEQDKNRKIIVGRHMTAKSLVKTSMVVGGSEVTINGNLCLDSIAQVQLGEIERSTPEKKFTVQKDVWVTHPNAFYANGGDFSNKYNLLILGNSDDSKVYIPDAYHSNDYVTLRNNTSFQQEWYGQTVTYKPYVDVASATDKYYFYYTTDNPVVTFDGTKYYVGGNKFPTNYHYDDGQKKRSPYCDQNDNNGNRPKLHVTPWFQSKVKAENFSRTLPSPRPVACADSVKEVCDNIWEKKPGCDGATYKVDDILTTAYEKFKSYADSGCAKNITKMDANFAKNLNACYNQNINDATKKQTHLYNGYLVVSVSSDQLVQEYGVNLKGKFVIILEEKPNFEVVFPPTEGDDDFAFVYMKKGATKIQSVPGPPEGTPSNIKYNYFFYTKADIGISVTSHTEGITIQPYTDGFLFKNVHFKGSIYAEAQTCAKLASIDHKNPLIYNSNLTNSLIQSKILCEASVTNCGGVATSSSSSVPTSSSASGSGEEDGKDSRYISIAPQLGVTLESQYKSTENIPNNASNVKPSFIVIPRVIYLSKNAPGRLEDYYSIVNLNGGNEAKTPSKVDCGSFSQTTGKLTDTGNLTPGLYTCTYDANNANYSNPQDTFYVYVNNTSEELPEVNFTTSEQTLDLSSSTTVKVHIGKATDLNGKIKFDFTLDDDYPGWHTVPATGVTERVGKGFGTRFFTVEVTPNMTAEQDIDILTITTDANADDGDLYIYLSTPTELCKLGSNTVHHVKVMGHTTINRASIAEYCSTHSCDENLQEKSYALDCDYDSKWVTVSGTGCSEKVQNNSWSCLTNTAISLTSINADAIPTECEIVIPSIDNTIDHPVAGQTEYLYASVKRKRVNLTVELNNATDNRTYINVYDSYTTNNYQCTKANSPCTFKVLAGSPITISHEDFGEDNGNFSYWQCSGDNCASENYYGKENDFVFYGPHTITAEYHKESHCYYDDFSEMRALFCTSDAENCIDTCQVAPNNLQICRPKGSKQPKSNWLMTYYNKGSGSTANYIHPNIASSYSLYAPTTQDKPSIILRNKGVGPDGTMFALVQTSLLDKNNTKDFLNSGLIFRSNGEKHLILNVYGTSKPDNSGELTFRVCKIEGQSISSTTEGNCKQVTKKAGIAPISITSSSFVKIRFTIDDKNLLSVKAIVDNDVWEGEVSVTDFGLNGSTYTYVGFSLADPDFKIYDNGWYSLLEEPCWEIPTITCTFEDKYGTIPVDEEVSPEVSLSSWAGWFQDHNCIVQYYYNGCDNETSDKVNCGSEEIGQPGKLGSELNGDTYRFTQVGQHGYLIDENKKAQEASVKAVCPGDQTSLDLAQDSYSCGAFNVGAKTFCSSDIEVFNDQQYFNANETLEFAIPNSSNESNMRSATLHINVELDEPGPNKDLNANLTIQLKSSKGMNSLTRTISQTGDHKISVDNITKTTGCNPEEISKVIITSDNNIYIKKLHIHSQCTNKLELKCERAHYDYQKGGWIIDISPVPTNDVTCTYTSNNSNIQPQSDIEGCNTVLGYKQNAGFYWLYSEPPTFTVTAQKNHLTKTCTIKGEQAGNNGITCNIVGSDTITTGSKAPNFDFKYGTATPGWNAFTIPYTITLDGTPIKTGSAKYGEQQRFEPTDSEIPESGGHTYKVIYTFSSGFGEWTQECSANFNVKDPTKNPPTITSCSIDNNNGKFTASISNPDNVASYTYTFQVSELDVMGQIISNVAGTSNTTTGDQTNLEYTYNPNKAGIYGYSITIGDNICSQRRTVDSPLELQCSNITNQNANEAISVTPTVKNCNPCYYKIYDGETEKSDDLVFYDNGATGTKQYSLQATDSYGNTATCPFTVTFISQNSNIVELVYNDNYHTFDVGTHTIKCTTNKEGNVGHLVCECPVLAHDYNDCAIIYNGTKKTFMYNNTVDDSPCGNLADPITIEVPSPIPAGNNKKEQPAGIRCKHSW